MPTQPPSPPPSTKSIANSTIQYRQRVMPGDTNPLNTLFGGTLLSWVDLAASMAAQKHSLKEVVTVHMDNITFKEPVHLGDQVVIRARVTYTGRTSMEIEVQALRENPAQAISQLCLTAFLTFVALDQHRRPTPVPPLVPESSQELQLMQLAGKRVNKRKS